MIDIRVISLPESLSRREAVDKQLSRLKVEYQFFDAVDGFGADPLLQRMDQKKFLFRNNRYPIAREAGCYASHFRLWELCVANDRPMLIMEDDFDITECSGGIFNVIENLVQTYPFLKLERLVKKKSRALVSSQDGVKIFRYRKAPHCLLAYAISPVAAVQLLRSREQFLYPVDVFVRNFGIHGVPIFGMDPPLVDRSALNYESSTIGDRSLAGPKWARLPRLYFKARNSLLNLWRFRVQRDSWEHF